MAGAAIDRTRRRRVSGSVPGGSSERGLVDEQRRCRISQAWRSNAASKSAASATFV